DILDFGGLSLDETEERLDLIFKLKRKYGDSEEKILEYLKNAKDELDSITTSEERRLETEANIKKLTDDAIKLAEEIREIRTLTAEEIEKKIENELSELNMEGAKFSVSFEESELSPNGADKIEFLLSANKGEPLKPLSKIVSGGELSRIMLALKNVLFAGDVVDTLIFDEIDSGISGRAAGKVGAKLSEIAEKKQVLCVTHLPQIASLSQSHFKISKSEKDSKTLTTVKMLSRDERVSEIALMIGGDNVTETTLAQAEEMIK
ncbi:MAG: DNA repair protein RecN, partial [Clostridia bacterium]|nr:DNA repair protein RecN [Clostridia bacterium]